MKIKKTKRSSRGGVVRKWMFPLQAEKQAVVDTVRMISNLANKEKEHDNSES